MREQDHLATSERISYKLLCLLLKKYCLSGSIADHQTIRAKKKIADEHYRFIDECTAENEELTAYIASCSWLAMLRAAASAHGTATAALRVAAVCIQTHIDKWGV